MTTQFSFSTTSDAAANALSPQIKGKTILITGSTKSGLGLEVARAISLHSPKRLIITARSASKLQDSVELLSATAPNVEVRTLGLDLSSFASVRKAAAEVNAWEDVSIDVLINNAAIYGQPYSKTEDGIESHFQTNHLGPWLLTNLIMPRIVAAGRGARIVNVSSRGHQASDVRWDDCNFEARPEEYNPFVAYGQSKTANILFTVALAEKLASEGVKSYALHPGAIRTNYVDTLNEETLAAMRGRGLLDENNEPVANEEFQWKTLEQGASTSIVAAFDPEIEERSGAYLNNGRIDQGAVKSYAIDKGSAQRLWKLSEELAGEKFEY